MQVGRVPKPQARPGCRAGGEWLQASERSITCRHRLSPRVSWELQSLVPPRLGYRGKLPYRGTKARHEVLRTPPGNLPLWRPAAHTLLCGLLFSREQTRTFCPAQCAEATLQPGGRCAAPPRGRQRAEGLLSTVTFRGVFTPLVSQI